ncbi:murein hydrolase activator EnvC family protein [Rhodopila sp.]|uniref:murein hydrolase activator EnvC family protein n=1 Tax=Rhodopila sp. TaxID=2480087 RepID=UPI003D1065DA
MARRSAIRQGRGIVDGAARAVAFLLVLITLVPSPAVAASPKQDAARRDLRDSERLRREQVAAGKDAAARADRAAADALRLSQERVQAAAKLQQADAVMQGVTSRIDALAVRQREAEQRVKANAAAIQPLLPLVERLSLYPAETLLAVPGSPESTLRGLLVLKGLSRQIELETETLRRDQADLDAATDALRAEAPRLAQARAAQAHEAEALDQQIAMAHASRAKAEAEASLAANRAALAAARTDTLRAALTVLEEQQRVEAANAQAEAERAERQKRPEVPQAAQRREAMLARIAGAPSMVGAAPIGQLQPPVIGVVVKRWGDQTDSGPAIGISYDAPPHARVISPCGGHVVFADSFRSYGLLLIVDCGGGYHVVLSGLDRLDVKLGQSIVTGEPVGVMPSWEPGSTAPRPALYVELRHNGQPVNPALWLRAAS